MIDSPCVSWFERKPVSYVPSCTQFREYQHVAQALGHVYRPIAGIIPPAAFEARLWIDSRVVQDAVQQALADPARIQDCSAQGHCEAPA